MNTEQRDLVLEKLERIETLLQQILVNLTEDEEVDSSSSVNGQDIPTPKQQPYVFHRDHLTMVHLRPLGYRLSEATETRQNALRNAIASNSYEDVYEHLQALHHIWERNLKHQVERSKVYVDSLADDIAFLETNYM